jgi:phage major head subunit gpT-like protein
MISGNVPTHLLVAARTGFIAAVEQVQLPWQRFTRVLDMNAKSIDLVDLGAAPMPTENKGRTQVRDFIEKKLVVTPKDWDITVSLSHNAIQDDQTATLETKVRSAGENFQRHMNNIAFDAINVGNATTTYGACYDGLSFFNDAHVDAGAEYTTAQDNNYALGFSFDNFKAVRAAGRAFLDDQGEPLDLVHNLIVAHPDYEYEIENLIGNPERFDQANRAANVYQGKMQAVYSTKITSGRWFLLNADQPAKPLIMALRERPNLQSAWFDPNAPDGGLYYFKFYARYNVFYGDWRLAIKGN